MICIYRHYEHDSDLKKESIPTQLLDKTETEALLEGPIMQAHETVKRPIESDLLPEWRYKRSIHSEEKPLPEKVYRPVLMYAPMLMIMAALFFKIPLKLIKMAWTDFSALLEGDF